MDSHSRRSFVQYLAAQMPGRPVSSQQEKSAGGLRVLAVAAHPGDAFFAMGAPVALEVSLGGQGTFLSLSLGERGSASIPPVRYGALQREAAERAAQLLSAHPSFLAWPDGQIPVNEDVKLAVCDVIRRVQPAIIITHWKGSWHKDHRACYEIVSDAMFYAGLPAIARKDAAHTVAQLFYADNWEDADGFRADTYLDITPVFERWSAACALFPMWRGENGFRYNDYYSSLAVERGCLSGFRYAVALMSAPEQMVRHKRSL